MNVITEELYDRFATLIRERAGLHYPEQRRADLIYGLQRAAQHFGISDPCKLFSLIERYPAAWDELIAELTIGETYFFRNAAQFAALREIILPDLIQRRSMVRYLRVWSAGCATGEEPYSIAITLREQLPSDPPWQISILATDINRHFLARAREACFGNWSFRETPPEVRDRYFVPVGGQWQLRREIRADVTFAQLNLVEPVYPSPQLGIIAFDIIFCRNVMIYFDEATTRQVVQRLYDSLIPGGWLVVGHAEPNVELYRQFETHNAPGTVLYRKPLSAAPFAPASALPSSLEPTPAPLATPPPAPPKPAPSRASAPPAPVTAPAESPEDFLRAAQTAADQGDWNTAESILRALLKAYPLFAPAYYLQAQIAEHHGDFETALADYRRSVYLNPQFIMGYVGMANVAARLKQPDTARRSSQRALRLIEQLPDDQIIDSHSAANAAELRAYLNHLLQQLNR
ncbi:CheR family methyltransferase [Chloroflexus sp.]|uniref:CheR family methyltransferase n=1 Tax=Chloroflexus sp. TaxID=1904827 RepID=UPI002603F16E|nr:CheR family methyltransferase [uncultured Chloroflexus sp.]